MTDVFKNQQKANRNTKPAIITTTTSSTINNEKAMKQCTRKPSRMPIRSGQFPSHRRSIRTLYAVIKPKSHPHGDIPEGYWPYFLSIRVRHFQVCVRLSAALSKSYFQDKQKTIYRGKKTDEIAFVISIITCFDERPFIGESKRLRRRFWWQNII